MNSKSAFLAYGGESVCVKSAYGGTILRVKRAYTDFQTFFCTEKAHSNAGSDRLQAVRTGYGQVVGQVSWLNNAPSDRL